MKRVFLILVALLTLSLSGNSQNATPVQRDTSKVVLSTEVARKVLIDLERKDALEKEREILLEEVENLKQQDTLSSYQISNLKQQKGYLENLLEMSKVTSDAREQRMDQIEKSLSKASRLNLVLGTTTAFTTLGLIIALIATKN